MRNRGVRIKYWQTLLPANKQQQSRVRFAKTLPGRPIPVFFILSNWVVLHIIWPPSVHAQNCLIDKDGQPHIPLGMWSSPAVNLNNGRMSVRLSLIHSGAVWGPLLSIEGVLLLSIINIYTWYIVRYFKHISFPHIATRKQDRPHKLHYPTQPQGSRIKHKSCNNYPCHRIQHL